MKGTGVFALRRRGRITANSEIATLPAEDQRRLDEINRFPLARRPLP
jgi:hypothetical protein